MAWELPLFKLPSFVANADLSAKQFHAVTGDGAGKVKAATAEGWILGVLQNDPLSGHAAEIMNEGVTKAIAGDAIAVYEEVVVDGNGAFIPVDGGSDDPGAVVGRALEAASETGAVFTLLLY